MKLENLKLNITLKGNNDNEVVLNFEVGSLELSAEEHSEECKLMEKFLPALNSMLNELTEEMTKNKAEDMTKKK